MVPAFTDMLTLFRATVREYADRTAVLYFDGTMSYADLDSRSDAFAGYLLSQGFSAGDRVALYLQNDPTFVVALVGTWKAGGTAVAINPMYRHRELQLLLSDSGATVLVCLDTLYDTTARDVLADGATQVRRVLVSSPRDDQTRNDSRVLGPDVVVEPRRFAEVTALMGASVPTVNAEPDDTAMLVYTSGTTGKPKGAMISHRSFTFSSQTYRDWIGLGPNDRILGVAPLFHITGLIGHLGVGLLTGAAIVLNHRFEPSVLLDLVREHRPTFTVGSVTVFNNLAERSDVAPDDFSSFRAVYCGGAPIAPALRERIRDRIGIELNNLYGMTETTSPAIGVPFGAEGRVDPKSGSLAIGVPVFDTTVRIIDEHRHDLPVGEVGEIAISGPQVISAYWDRPVESAEKIVNGEIATGDVGFMDRDGWFYLVDRKNDMIIASGYKVWPREVEDVLYSHPAVREAAVIGVPDSYRGETVLAVVSLKPRTHCTEEDLIDFCKARMAAYKYPRQVRFVDELPKATTGKILRRELRLSTDAVREGDQ
ncbi:class I adenylate-forming enzyme family protein [Rhodococcus qingshengii]|uniref:class I adenylate-forming enzyme family protein n=1 Tax=Rhodococcus qingshengii TaxID=334542 RepID=UPI0007E586CA|nr:AMP-binding protein [Rhodococcus qingshengii]